MMRWLSAFLFLCVTLCGDGFAQKIIAIDAGHGGHIFGAFSEAENYYEKDFTLTTALRIRQLLEQLGYQVVMTREKDVVVPVPFRAQIANKAKADVYLSVHYNKAEKKPEAHGIEIFYFEDPKDHERTRQSIALAHSVLKQVLAKTQAKSRGVRGGEYPSLVNTRMPAVIIEPGFLSNAAELKKLRDPAYIEKIAQGIVQGLHDYLSQGK